MNNKLLAAAAGIALLASNAAHAAVVDFFGDPSLIWADGTFSHDLTTTHHDGFYVYNLPNSGFNGFGQNGESIYFNAPVKLFSLGMVKCTFCYDSSPTGFTVSLFDTGHVLLASQTIAPSYTLQTMNFGTSHVSSITFSFAGGEDRYGSGSLNAWYGVADVTYGAVPEPANWTLMILGFGLMGTSLRARRKADVLI